MKRRKLLLGLGTVAAGGTAIASSGAFSKVEAEKQLSIAIAEDRDAFLALEATDSTNSEAFVETTGNGNIVIDISDNEQAGGVNRGSVTVLDSLLRVCNQGTEETTFYIHSPDDEAFAPGVSATTRDGTDRLQLYVGNGDAGRSSVMGDENAVAIPLGECRDLGVRVVTTGIDADVDQLIDEELTFVGDILEDPAFSAGPLPGRPLPTQRDPETGSKTQFDSLQSTDIETNGIELYLRQAGVDGEATVGV